MIDSFGLGTRRVIAVGLAVLLALELLLVEEMPSASDDDDIPCNDDGLARVMRL